MDKVFGIGFHKTATSSLERALEMLGYRVYGPAPEISDRERAKEVARKVLQEHDALQDVPWPVFYKWFDHMYPGSKFILTIRPEDKWIKSVCQSFKEREFEAHEWIYGVDDPIGNEEEYLKVYRQHNESVLEYFSGRRGEDLLVMDITNGDGWEKLCPFLGKRQPWLRFPRRNISDSRLRKMPLIKQMTWKIEKELQIAVKHKKRGQLLKKAWDRITRIK